MHRKFRTFGVFDWKRCDGTLLRDRRQQRIALALKHLGFQETKWQFIYDGQLFGLVYPHGVGKNEVHVRFYHDHIFAEYEVGRASLAHFFSPFLNANKYLELMLKEYLCDDDYRYLLLATRAESLREEERALSDWDFLADASELAIRGYGNFLSFKNAERFSGLLSWRLIMSGVLGIASVLTLANTLWIAFAATISAFLVIFINLPQVGRP
jgi:hypothetical protein